MNLHNASILRGLTLGLFASIALVACSGDDKASASDTSDASSSGTSTGGESSSSASASSTSDGGSAGGSMSDGSSGSTGASTSGSTTTDSTSGSTGGATTGGSGDIPGSCAAACAKLVECGQFPGMDECVTMCIEESTPLMPDAVCEAAMVAFNECLAGATCDELMGDMTFPCAAEEDAIQMVCGGGEACEGSAGSDPNTMTCSISETCPSYDHMIECSVKECTCYEDGNMTATCPVKIDVDPCSDLAIVSDLALECCGWQI